MSDAVSIVIYTCTECHLCNEAEATVREVADEMDATVDIDFVNADSDGKLREKYGERVPYVYVNGRPAFKLRVDADRLRGKLTAVRE